MSLEVHSSELDQVLDRAASVIELVIVPGTARAYVAFAAAIVALWLMQDMTRHASWRGGIIPVMRWIQRCALAWLSLGLMLWATQPFMNELTHQDLIGFIVSVAIFFLLGASVVLVHVNPPKK